MDFVYLAMMFVGTELIYGQVQAIAGWTKNEVLLLVLTVALFNDFMWTFFYFNLRYFSDLVREGNLDFVLLKPVNSRFLISTRYFEFDHFLRMPLIIYFINKLVRELNIRPNLFSWFQFYVLFFFGLFIVYNFFFIITTLNFWFIRIFNLSNLFDDIVEIARFPSKIFQGKLKYLFVYIIPSIFIAFLPVEVLLGRRGLETIIFAILISVFLFGISQKFWNFALKHYSSASS